MSISPETLSESFDENGMIVSTEYKEKVLSLNRSPLYASLKWLQNMKSIDDKDLGSVDVSSQP
jgi:hypothetical protein